MAVNGSDHVPETYLTSETEPQTEGSAGESSAGESSAGDSSAGESTVESTLESAGESSEHSSLPESVVEELIRRNPDAPILVIDRVDDPTLEGRGVGEVVRRGILALPAFYIKPEDMRQQSSSMADPEDALDCLPIIDLASPRDELLSAMADACEWGFFQIVNHGSDPQLLHRMLTESQAFFALPVEEKIRCTTPQRLGGPIHFGGGSQGDWRDVLKIHCAPASAVAMEYWPVNPVGYRETIMEYSTAQQVLVRKLLEIISESLGLESDYIIKECEDPRVLYAIHQYPPCPDPSLTMGIREHSDPNTITILQQNDVVGLQMYKDGMWYDVKPVENALIVNVGDHLQILSNGKYSSCLHRVVTNKTRTRISIALFYSPAMAARVKPAPALVDDEHPSQYVEFTYSEFLNSFYRNGGANKKVILSQFNSQMESETDSD